MSPTLPIRRVWSIEGKTPPNAMDAEAAVLSAVLLKPGTLAEVAPIVRPEHFYAEPNQLIFEAITWLDANEQAVDPVTVSTYLSDRGKLNVVGGTPYLAQLCEATPAVYNVVGHAKLVAEKARRRRIIELAHEVLAEGYGDVGDEAEWATGVESRFVSLLESNSPKETSTIGDALRRYWSAFSAEADGKAVPVGGCFGIADLDDLLGPLKAGRITCVGGFWGDGKSALGAQVALATALDGRPVDTKLPVDSWPSAALFMSTEMTDEELAQRALFSTARVDSSKARPTRHGDISTVEWRALQEAGTVLSKLPVWIDDRAEVTPSDIRASVRRHKALAKRAGRVLRVVVVDYLQLVDGRQGLGKQANREQEVANVARALKKLAKSEDVHVVALAQLNDDPNKRGKDERKPTSRDFRESKAIPQNADNVVLIYNPAARERARQIHSGQTPARSRTGEDVELIVDKHRGGPTGTVKAVFFPALTRFDNAGGW